MRRLFVATIAAFTVMALSGISAHADIIEPSPTPVQAVFVNSANPSLGLAPITIVATGYTPGEQVFVEQCDGNAPTVLNWDPTINCDSGTSPAPVIADSTGSVYFDASSANHKFVPFKGESPQDDFNCIGLSDPPLAPSDGVPDFNDCQVRVSSSNAFSTDDQQFFSLVVPNDPGSALIAQYANPSAPSQGLAPMTITAAGFVPGQQVFVEQCDGNPTTAPGWDPTIDCDSGSSPAPVLADGSGNATFSATSANHKFVPFRGASPQQNFNCVASADPASTNGLTDYTNCQVRVSSNNASSTSDQQLFALTVPAGVPDAPAIGTASASSGSASVSFTPGSDNGYAITGYTATCTSANGGATQSVSGSSSPIVVTGTTDGRTYTCTVTATNGAGTSQPSTASNSTVFALVPDAPANVSANAANNAAQVVFTAPQFNGPPFDNGSAVTMLTATCTSGDGGAASPEMASAPASPILVTGMTNGDTYTCTVNATNGVGTGPDSSPSNSVVPAAVPDAPTIGTATFGNASASVTFTPNGDNGFAITGFNAVCTSSDGGATGSNPNQPSSPIVVTGLTNGDTYTCTVSAINSQGSGPVSAASNTFIPTTPPSIPTSVVITRGDASVGVSFTPGDTGGITTQYDASCTSSGSGTPGSTLNAAGSPIIVTGLTNGQAYTCTVTAHNAVGSSGPSAASNSVTPGKAPDAPTIGTAARDGAGSLSVSFAPGADNGYAISSFTATCTSSDSGAASPMTGNGSSSPLVVNGLTDGDTYSCTVHAANAVGNSLESAASNSIIPATIPSAPTIGVLARSGTGLHVAFTEGTSNGLPITNNTATCTATGGVTAMGNSATSPITVAGETLGKTYTCSVTSTNGVGTGPASGNSNAVLAAAVPSPPTALNLTPGSTTTTTGPLTLTFTAGATNGSALTTPKYTATCTATGGVTKTVTGTTTTIAISGATTGKTYTCTVKAHNAIGTGSASAASPAATVGAPARVATPTATKTAAGTLKVTFTALTTAQANGSALSTPKYTAVCVSTNGGDLGTATGTGSPITVGGLTAGKAYSCFVAAHNARGYSRFSVGSTSKTA